MNLRLTCSPKDFMGCEGGAKSDKTQKKKKNFLVSKFQSWDLMASDSR